MANMNRPPAFRGSDLLAVLVTVSLFILVFVSRSVLLQLGLDEAATFVDTFGGPTAIGIGLLILIFGDPYYHRSRS